MKYPLNLAMNRTQCAPGVRGQKGIALIEALVSILIFAFGLLGLIGLEARAINFSVDAEDRNRAAMFANEVAGAMWTSSSVTLSAATIATLQARIANAASGEGLASGTLAIAVVPPNIANITITWRPVSHSTEAITTSTFTTQVILP